MSHGAPSDPSQPPPERKSSSDESILDSLARRGGRGPRVRLRDAGGEDAAAVVEGEGQDPEVRSFQEELARTERGKYRVLGEIARGGMGIVLRGHDAELGRDVAMKVVHAELADRPDVVARFVEEAQVGGQLQHPGIVPVYELGLMADQRPYFTMKLIKGRTLAAMLAGRKAPEEERLRYLRVFEAVCQTMAYAHSKGVIHRDLKPANVMVGAFGEVQVVDWGLSKVLPRGDAADEVRDEARTVIETVRSGPGTETDSLIGNVLGTPAYMSPEQARGEIDRLDERTDVFALGAILCELLTGAPPYVAVAGENPLQKAALAELDDARARVAAANAPEELKKLCQACLLPTRQARPASAGALADAVHGHIAGLETAAHQAQLAAAEQRVAAERSRRRQQLVVFAAAVVLLLAGGGWWLDTQHRARQAELERGLDEARALVQREERAGTFERAVDAASAGLRLVEAGGAGPELVARAQALVASTEEAWRAEEERRAEAAREEQLLSTLADLQMRQIYTGVNLTDADVAEGYRSAFADYGIELSSADLGPRLLALRDTELGVALALGFDGWARALRRMRERSQDDVELLTGIGFDLDGDPVRTEVRHALVGGDASGLVETAREIDLAHAAPETIFLLASALGELDETALSVEIVTAGADLHPSDFALTSGAGLAYVELGEMVRAQAYLSGALALRPDLPLLHSWLGDARKWSGDVAGSRHSMQRALDLAPLGSWNRLEVALDSMFLGRFEEAEEVVATVLAGSSERTIWEHFLRACRLYRGEGDIDGLVAEGQELLQSIPEGLSWSMLALALWPPPGRAPDPERALRLIAQYPAHTLKHPPVWIAAAAAHAELGHGAETLATAVRAHAMLDLPGDRGDVAITLLIAAVGARIEGSDAAADLMLLQARRLRDGLVAGRESDWEQSMLVHVFRRFEPLAERR